MTKFIIRRLLQAIPTFFGITMLSYAIVVLAPGNPVDTLFFGPSVKPEEKEFMAKRFGINDPLPMQYLRWLIGDDWKVVDEIQWYHFDFGDDKEGWLSERQFTIDPETNEIKLKTARQPFRVEPSETAETLGSVGRNAEFNLIEESTVKIWGENKGILRGDFGNSFSLRRSPLTLLGERLGASIELNIAVLITGMSLGVSIGILSAVWRGGMFDQFARVLAVVGDSVPSFWIAFMAIMIFSEPGLGWFPMGDRAGQEQIVDGGYPPIYERLQYLVLPVAVLALGSIAGWSRYMRAAMLENIHSDYIRTARSKGLMNRTIWFKHALRNALIPMATFLGPLIGILFSGAVVIEQIFNWPGIGQLTLAAVSQQDYPMVMAAVVIGSILTIFGYLLSDILYALFDPRIRL